MSGVVVGDLRWEVRVRGAGVPLLLLHGFMGRGASWGAHAAAFAREFRVVVVDLPGHGRSEIPSDPARASVERSADDLAEILVRAVTLKPTGHRLDEGLSTRTRSMFQIGG
jgi:2-succinyl-6-hydroxy-2,4-cyclohexadiene-1-carboxylate synthase